MSLVPTIGVLECTMQAFGLSGITSYTCATHIHLWPKNIRKIVIRCLGWVCFERKIHFWGLVSRLSFVCNSGQPARDAQKVYSSVTTAPMYTSISIFAEHPYTYCPELLLDLVIIRMGCAIISSLGLLIQQLFP